MGRAKYAIGNRNGACVDWDKAVSLGDLDAKALLEQYCIE
jgi:hypothetical protein